MLPWWSGEEAGLWGGLAGAAVGVTCGIYGALVGVCAARGCLGRWALWTHGALIGAGLMIAATGVFAVVVGQPWHVWYPLTLCGAILAFALGSSLPAVRGALRQREQRRMDAEGLRRGM